MPSSRYFVFQIPSEYDDESKNVVEYLFINKNIDGSRIRLI